MRPERPKRADFGPERVNFRSERADEAGDGEIEAQEPDFGPELRD